MNITFLDTQVFQLNFDATSQEENINLRDFDISFSPVFSKSNSNEFVIIFKLSLNNEEFSLLLEYAARFSVDAEIDEEFKTSHFVKVNAPAIAYPFLRAYISNLTLNSGFLPIILPTINFTKFNK
ncbi:MAG: preprotein translocase subunit SecB [Methyloprofundus sp.]|nr:preprotein translocase subunit SecB [Methyloprofundus sp.]